MQPRRGVGAEFSAGFRPVECKALYTNALALALVGPGDGETAIRQARHVRSDETFGLRAGDLALRPGQRVLIEGAQLDLEETARRLFIPGDRKALAGFDDFRQLPFCPRVAGKVHHELV